MSCFKIQIPISSVVYCKKLKLVEADIGEMSTRSSREAPIFPQNNEQRTVQDNKKNLYVAE